MDLGDQVPYANVYANEVCSYLFLSKFAEALTHVQDEENKLIYAGIAPLFSYSPTSLHDDITTAVPLGWVEDIYPREVSSTR